MWTAGENRRASFFVLFLFLSEMSVCSSVRPSDGLLFHSALLSSLFFPLPLG